MTQNLVSKAGTRAQKLAAIRPNIGRAILGGFVATPAMSVLMYTVDPLMGVRVDIADVLGTMLGGWTLGMIAHMINGSILFPLLYVLVAAHFHSGPERIGIWRRPLAGLGISSHAYDGSGRIQQPPGAHGCPRFIARSPCLWRAARFSGRGGSSGRYRLSTAGHTADAMKNNVQEVSLMTYLQ